MLGSIINSATAAAQTVLGAWENLTARSGSSASAAHTPLMSRESQEAFNHAISFRGKDFAQVITLLTSLIKEDSETEGLAHLYLIGTFLQGETTGTVADSANMDFPKASFHFRKAMASPNLTDDQKQSGKTGFIGMSTDTRLAPEIQNLIVFHLKLTDNPTYIQDIIDDASTDVAGMKVLIEELIQYEKPLLEPAEFQAYLMQILTKDAAYLDHMLPLLSLEDKIALSGFLQREENQAPYFRAIGEAIKHPDISAQLKAEYTFYYHDEIMKNEILAECTRQGAENLDALCKTQKGFEAYQAIFTTFKPTFIECSRAMSGLKAQGVLTEEEDMISEPIENTHHMYRDYKEASRTQEIVGAGAGEVKTS